MTMVPTEVRKSSSTRVVVPEVHPCGTPAWRGPEDSGCKYIDLPEDTVVMVPMLEDHHRTRIVKGKRSFEHFLCPPYFILAASVMEIFIYVLADENIDKMLIYSPQHRHQVWRFVTYMLLHSGLVHLTLNVIIQTLLATPLELEQGWWRCAVIYSGGGLVGALGASVFQPTLYMVGSSAGVYALLIAHISNVMLRYNTIKYKWYRLFAVGILACSDIAFSVAHYQVGFDNLPKIGWAAHCAGAFAGLTIGLIIFRGDDKSNWFTRLSIGISIFLLALGTTGAIVYNFIIVIT